MPEIGGRSGWHGNQPLAMNHFQRANCDVQNHTETVAADCPPWTAETRHRLLGPATCRQIVHPLRESALKFEWSEGDLAKGYVSVGDKSPHRNAQKLSRVFAQN